MSSGHVRKTLNKSKRALREQACELVYQLGEPQMSKCTARTCGLSRISV